MRYTALVLFLSLTLSAAAQLDVRMQADSTRIYVGDQLHLRLSAAAETGVRVGEADLGVFGQLEKVELLRHTEWDSTKTDGKMRYTCELYLTAWDSGFYYLPAVPVEFVQNGNRGSRAGNTIPLRVELFPIDTTALAPIKDIIGEPFLLSDYYFLIGIVLAVLAMIGLIWYALRRKRPVVVAPPPPPRPAHEIALERLAQLRRTRPWESGRLKSYHSDLTDTLRTYLEGRFGLPAPESTTSQLRPLLQQHPEVPDDWIPRLRELLEVADLVKFAKATPPPAYHERFLDDAERFVRETRPVTQADPDGNS